ERGFGHASPTPISEILRFLLEPLFVLGLRRPGGGLVELGIPELLRDRGDAVATILDRLGRALPVVHARRRDQIVELRNALRDGGVLLAQLVKALHIAAPRRRLRRFLDRAQAVLPLAALVVVLDAALDVLVPRPLRQLVVAEVRISARPLLVPLLLHPYLGVG